jgi:dihydroflavonol-4-reductase
MEKGHSGEIYILAADEHYTLKDVLDLFARYSGLPPVRDFCIPMPLLILSSWFQKDSVLNTEMIENFLTWNWIFDNAKAKKALGFAPKEARRAWLETIIWAAENGYLPRKVARKVLDYALRQ